MSYRPHTTIKGQALTDFIREFTYFDIIEVAGTIDNAEVAKELETEKGRTSATKYEDNDQGTTQWTLCMDGASNENGLRAGMMLISPEVHKIHCDSKHRKMRLSMRY